MKYIRTTDGRIVQIPGRHKEIVYDGKIVISLESALNGEKGTAIVNGFVERKADTIEELCDAFVLWFGNTPRVYFTFKRAKRAWASKSKDGEVELFGVIFSHREIKYVSKIKENGEFELL